MSEIFNAQCIFLEFLGDETMIKAIFFDMDGTLVGYSEEGKGKIPDSAREVLGELRAKGVKIFAATGRCRGEMDTVPFLRTVPFDAVAAMNGQYCYTDEEELLVSPLSPEDLQGFLDLQQEGAVPAIIVGKRESYVNMFTPEFSAAIGKIDSVLPEVLDCSDLPNWEVIQVVAFVDETEEKRVEAYMPGAKATRWCPEFVDVISRTGGKDKGIEAILKHFGLRKDEFIAFGDGQNDMGMLQTAKIGIAMGNADEKLKAVADEIADDVNADGVAKVLRRYLAEGLFDE